MRAKESDSTVLWLWSFGSIHSFVVSVFCFFLFYRIYHLDYWKHDFTFECWSFTHQRWIMLGEHNVEIFAITPAFPFVHWVMDLLGDALSKFIIWWWMLLLLYFQISLPLTSSAIMLGSSIYGMSSCRSFLFVLLRHFTLGSSRPFYAEGRSESPHIRDFQKCGVISVWRLVGIGEDGRCGGLVKFCFRHSLEVNGILSKLWRWLAALDVIVVSLWFQHW